MSLLKVGSKTQVFVTHVEFGGSECQIFCQVGDIGGQADTLAERVAESVENGLASQISSCNVGDLCLALFHEDNSWYRGRVLKNLGNSFEVYFIDYGNTEIVKMNDIRAAPEYVLAIPALSTKCTLSDCTPLSGVWTEEEKKKIETMLHSGEFTCEILKTGSSDQSIEVYTVKLYNNDAPNTPIFVRPASGSSQSLKKQNLSVGQEYEVYVSYVESVKKFWVQLKNQETDLNSLMADIGACFAEDLPSTGDIVYPSNDQVCAACFSDDGAFYRGIVKNVEGGSCTVFFVDYGNNEEKKTSELFTLPQALCQHPMQAVQCSYKEDSPAIEDILHKLAEDEGPSVLKVLSGSATSGYVVEINSVEQKLHATKVKMQNVQTKGATKLWQSYTSVVMQVDGIYDVCVSHIDHPGQFYVQLLGNANNLDKLMQAVDEVAHNYDKLTNLYQGYPCLAKFSDGSWYRGEVVTAEVGKTVVAAVDFGFKEVVHPSELRNTDPNFKLQPAQAVKCTIDMTKTDSSMWKTTDTERFKALTEKSALVAKVSMKNGSIHQVNLHKTENSEERHLNIELLNDSVLSNVPARSQPKHHSETSAPAVQLPPPDVKVGSKYILCFTAVKSSYIYGQLTSTPVEKVAKLQTDLNTFFEKKTGEKLLKVEKGSVCCTRYVDGGWYRGIVTSVSGENAEVAFVDFGDSVMKSINDLKVLPPTLCSLPQQCILCKIVNVPPSTGPDKLKNLVNKRIEVNLCGKEDGVYPTYGTDITDRQIVAELQGTQVSQPAVFKGASSRTFGRTQKDDVSVPRTLPVRKPSGGAYTQQEVGVSSTQEVMVTYVKDPYNFQIVLDKMNSSLEVVMDQLHEYYDNLAAGADKLENPRLGQPCVAQFTEDNGWYRAVITGLKADGQAEVMYVDYGNNEYTDRDALKEIKKQFMSLPAQAVRCRLAGVSSAQGFWAPEHIVQFTEMVEEQSFIATFKAEIRDHGEIMYKVDLVDKKGTKVNEKFGTMTGTSCPETDYGPSSRSVTASNFGLAMKITVADGGEDSGWNDSGNSSFSNKPRGGGSGFGSRSSGFNSKPHSGDSGWDKDGSGFGNKKPFGRSGGFGGGESANGISGGVENRGGSNAGGDGFGKSGGFGSGSGTGFGGGGGGRDCFKCGESGHMARDCTNPPKAGGGGRECYKCGESGHMARDCTNPPKAGTGGGRDCYKCGEGGHMARDCTNPPKAGTGGGRDCYKCGESGHMARDCTNPPKGGAGGRDCYKCGESGHMARDCTNPPKEGAGPRQGFGRGNERSSGGGFGSKADNASEDWGDGARKSSSNGGFGARGSGGFGSHGGGFAAKPGGDTGGKFGQNRFGTKSSEDDWGGGASKSKPVSGGFGNKSSGFGGEDAGYNRSRLSGNNVKGGGGDDWDTETVPVSSQVTSQAGDGPDNYKIENNAVFSSMTLDIGETVDVYVVYVSNPEHFWCQLMKNCQELEQLMEEMNLFYNSLNEGDLIIERPEIGMPCAAKFSEDNMWYRAEILTPSQLSVEVQFVDYGNTENVAVDKLCKLKQNFMTLKTQGIKCGLDDLVATDKIWTKKAVEDFEDLTQDKHLVAKVLNRTSDMTHIIDLENLDEKMNIAEAMFEKQHCRFKGVTSSPLKKQLVKNPYPATSIQSGQEIDVYVSWIENPQKFWIQPVIQENKLIELVEKIQELYTKGAGVDMTTNNLVIGQAVVAQFTEDEAWYRGYVEELVGSKCKIRFADYGNSDLVDKEKIRCPTDELIKENSHAALCKLVGVRPLHSGQWTADAKDIMDGLVKDEVVKCNVVDVCKECHSVELVSKGVNVGEELINAAVVRGEKEALPAVNAETVKSSVGVFLFDNEVQLTIGKSEDVFVSHTDSVASFWCQPIKTAVKLEELMTQLEEHCKSGACVHDFKMNMACAAKYHEDDSWYRAKVTAAYEDSVEVLFVDYGNTGKVKKSDIRELTEDLVQLPPQAIECELVNSSDGSNMLTPKFTELVNELEIQAMVVDIQENIAVVHLTLPSGKDVGEELGLSASSFTPQTCPPTTPSTAAQSQKVELKMLTYPPTVMPSEPTKVFVTQIINPSEFYIQQADKESELNVLMSKVSKYCESEVQTITEPKVGHACCAKFSDDGCWYRAKIVSINGKNCRVEFVDYGNIEMTTVDDIKSIADEFLEAPPFVLQCNLYGIVPMDVEWSEQSVKKFEELAVEKDLSCEVIEGSAVTLRCDGTDISEALVECGVAKRVQQSTTTTPQTMAKYLPDTKVKMPTEGVDVYVSHVTTPADFYVQLVNQEEELNQFTEKLGQIYETTTDSLKVDDLSQGKIVCTKYSQDEAWYRARIEQINGENIDVLFIDYGNDEKTTVSNVRELKLDLVEKQPYAIRCNLNNVKPVQGDWTEESREFFDNFTSGKILQCEFLVGNNVCLKLDGTDVVDHLVEKGYASLAIEIISPSKRKGHFTEQSVPADCVSCFVSHVDDSGTLYIQLVCEEDALNTEVEKVQTLESSQPLDIMTVQKGDLVCARFSEDQSWYRAVVTNTLDGSVMVRFVDYGNCDEVKQTSDLRTLPEEYKVTPPLSYACSLQGLNNLTNQQIELLREITADEELTVTFITSSPEYEVQLENENQKNISQMLKEAVVEQAEDNETMIDAVEEIPQGQPNEDHQDPAIQDITPSVSAITEIVDDIEYEKLDLEQRVKVLVSHVESPSTFWVQKESEKSKLDSLQNTMHDFYIDYTDKQLAVESLCENMLIAALYPEDETWYRAKVISCDNEKVKVLFIDHGNTEILSTDCLRKLPAQFCNLPVQALECCLGGVQSSLEDWSNDVKQTFTELTAEKVLLLDVGSVDEHGVYKIQLLDMGLSVADQLLQCDIGVHIATPVAVSDKVKQVFSPDITDDVIAQLYVAKSSNISGQYGFKLRDLGEAGPNVSSKNVLVACITSPDDFWCRIQDNCYDFYQDKLQDSYSENKELLNDINQGDKCVVLIDDKEYHRGTVLTRSDNGVEVKLVDVGNSVTVPESNVFKLKPEFDTYPQLAFCCSLTGIVPLDSDTFTEDANKVFKETLLELSNKMDLPVSAKATVVKEENGIVVVEMTMDRKSIAKSLVEKGVAKFDESTIPYISDDEYQQNFGAFRNVQLDLDNDFDVVLIDCSDLNRLIFHSVNNLSTIKEIETGVSQAVSEKEGGEGIEGLKSGPCLSKCPEDSMWKRANIIGISGELDGEITSQLFKVFFVDYGSLYELPRTSIIPIPESLMEYLGQAVICQLDEIEPVDGEWSEECCNFFEDHYMGANSKLVAYVNNISRGIHEVFLSSRNEGEKSVNHLLVELGMAVPIAGSQTELSVLADSAETSFLEMSMSRQDSYGSSSDSSDIGETSHEPDLPYLGKTSALIEGDTSCYTEGDTSCFTEGDTSCFTEGDTSCFTEGDTSCMTEGDTSCFTEGDTSCLTEGDTSCLTEGDTSCLTEGDTSCLTEGDTSCLTGDTSCLTEGETSCLTEGDTSCMTDGDTSCLTEGDTSCLTEGDTSHMTEESTNGITVEDDSYCMEEGKSRFTDQDTQQLTERDTSQSTHIDTSQLSNEDIPQITEEDRCEESSKNTIDGSLLFCEHCSGKKEEVDGVKIECIHCQSENKVIESVDTQPMVKAELSKINDNSLQYEGRYSSGDENVSEHVKNLEIVNTCSGMNKLEKINLRESGYSKSDINPKSTEESDIDDSYRLLDYSPTGYTTSELDTSDLKDADTSTSDVDAAGIEGGGEDLSFFEVGDLETSLDEDKGELKLDEENNIIDLKAADKVIETSEDTSSKVLVFAENCEENLSLDHDADYMMKENKICYVVEESALKEMEEEDLSKEECYKVPQPTSGFTEMVVLDKEEIDGHRKTETSISPPERKLQVNKEFIPLDLSGESQGATEGKKLEKRGTGFSESSTDSIIDPTTDNLSLDICLEKDTLPPYKMNYFDENCKSNLEDLSENFCMDNKNQTENMENKLSGMFTGDTEVGIEEFDAVGEGRSLSEDNAIRDDNITEEIKLYINDLCDQVVKGLGTGDTNVATNTDQSDLNEVEFCRKAKIAPEEEHNEILSNDDKFRAEVSSELKGEENDTSAKNGVEEFVTITSSVNLINHEKNKESQNDENKSLLDIYSRSCVQHENLCKPDVESEETFEADLDLERNEKKTEDTEVNVTSGYFRKTDDEYDTDKQVPSPFSGTNEQDLTCNFDDGITSVGTKGETDAINTCKNVSEELYGENLTDIINADYPVGTEDDQPVSGAKTADQTEASTQKNNESDKEDFEDAPETNENKTEDDQNNSQVSNGETDSFFDADEENKKE